MGQGQSFLDAVRTGGSLWFCEIRNLERKKKDSDNLLAGLGVNHGNVFWVANKTFESSKFKFKFRRARTCELQGFFLELSNFSPSNFRTFELANFSGDSKN